MSSECFVFNDWILHDLRGDNGNEAQVQTLQLLRKLKTGSDSMAFLLGSSWARKANSLMSQTSPRLRSISKYLHQSILLDSEKCQRIHTTETGKLPDKLVGTVPPDDLYLFETYYAAEATLLVTTDKKLYDKVAAAPDIDVNIQLRDDFLEEYLAE